MYVASIELLSHGSSIRLFLAICKTMAFEYFLRKLRRVCRHYRGSLRRGWWYR